VEAKAEDWSVDPFTFPERATATAGARATDGLCFRQAGIPVYGVSGLFADIDDSRAHGRDERMSVTSFREGLEFLYRLVRTLASPTM
jgi:acetylornithine deacetylase/succinyl-diaminopimelate desuccinylase-like protein